jgi:hypothetical protein
MSKRALLAALLLASLPAVADADGAAPNMEMSIDTNAAALRLDEEARASFAANRTDEAIRKIQEALKLDFAPARLFNLGILFEKECKPAASAENFLRFREVAGCENAVEGTAVARDCEDALSRLIHNADIAAACVHEEAAGAGTTARAQHAIPWSMRYTPEMLERVTPAPTPSERRRTAHLAGGLALITVAGGSVALASYGYFSASAAHSALMAETLPIDWNARQRLVSQGAAGNTMGVVGVVLAVAAAAAGSAVLVTGGPEWSGP